MMKRWSKKILFGLLVITSVSHVLANEKEQQAIVDQKIKLETLQVVKDATQLIEDVGYPEKSRVKIYVTHGAGKYFGLQKVTIVVDGADRAEFNYNDLQLKALLRGAANRVYMGELSEGFHELVVVFEGKDRKGNIIKKAETWLFDKKPGEFIMVMNVADNESTLRPDFSFKIIKGEQ